MHVITGGAGFIGSNIAAELDDHGHDIAIVDTLGDEDTKWRNIAKRRVRDLITPDELPTFLAAGGRVESVIHMGGVSSTSERDVDLIARSNFRLSVDLWTWCAQNRVPYIYASSAATYGDGRNGFDDSFDESALAALRPLNPYGWSKHVFDRWACAERRAGRPEPPIWAGLKFFNVYGPNEYHKGSQRSVALQLFEQVSESGTARLFASEDGNYPDGGQSRDFVWVGDCVSIALWMLTGSDSAPNSIYNVGSGFSRTFSEQVQIMFRLLDKPNRTQFFELPEHLRGRYQYFTLANIEKLRDAGYDTPATSLEEGLAVYTERYLQAEDPFR